MTKQNNLYLELDPETNNENLQEIKNHKNLYIKLDSSNLFLLNRIPHLSDKNVTIELINNCKLEKHNALEIFLSKSRTNKVRIIITLKQVINTELLDYLTSINFCNLSVDLYWRKANNLRENLLSILNKYNSVQHFSIYPSQQPLYLDHKINGFKRYHHNMWSKNPKEYYASYDLQTIRDKQYTGIGKRTISRCGYSFWRGKSELKLDRKYIDTQDHIDRLNYYLPIEEWEFENYPLIDREKYLISVRKMGIENTHQELISNFFDS